MATRREVDRTPAGRLERQAEATRLRRDEKLSNTQIAERMGTDSATVWRWIGSTPKDYRLTAYPQHVYDTAIRLRREDKRNAEIAELIEVPENTLYAWMGPNPKHLRRNRDYSATSLPDRARYLRECGYTVTELHEEMGVPRATVGDWVKGCARYGMLD